MNTKHTPGPWIATVQPGQVVGVHTYTHQVMYGDDCIASLLTEADAHLISAAPDLLDACKLALAESETDPHNQDRINHARYMLRAAIAKAEGGGR
jgi:hypothetical protein